MTDKEKAEAYDEALERAKNFIENGDERERTIAESIFAGIIESEDERIRRALIENFKFFGGDFLEGSKWGKDDDLLVTDIIAWLEKQKAIDILNEEERKFADDIDSFRKDMDEAYQKGYNEGVRVTLEKQDDKPQKTSIWKHWKDGIAGNGNGEPIYLIKCGNTYSLSSGLGFECDYILLSDLDKCEQKPAQSKDDERIKKELIAIFKGQIPYTSEEDAKRYIAWLEKQGEQSICKTPSREVILAIWDLGNEWKELTNGSISTEYGTQLDYIQKHWQESEYYLRAKQGEHKPYGQRKECSDCQFNYAGEYKGSCELKRNEQKPADKVKPKFHEGDWVVVSTSDGEKVVQIDSIEYFKSGEPRYITSEGRWFGNGTKARLLTDVKNITLPESKAIKSKTWNEEDTNLLDNCISLIEDIPCTDDEQNWLKSIKDRYTWKPSDAQMEFLQKCIEAYNEVTFPTEVRVLSSLYNDLKKLKEE